MMQPNQVLKTWPTGQEVPEVTKQPKPDAKKYGLQVEHKMPHFWLWVKGKFLHLSSVIIWGTSTYLLQQPAKLPLLLLELQPPKESLLKAHCTPGVKLKALVFEKSIGGDTWFCCSTQCAERVLLCSLFKALLPCIRNMQCMEQSWSYSWSLMPNIDQSDQEQGGATPA